MNAYQQRVLCALFVFGTAASTFAQNNAAAAIDKGKREDMSSREINVEVMRKLFRAVEDHDEESVLGLYQPDVEFHWPPSLPYGGSRRGLRATGPTWGETWAVLQPTEAERKMDPRFVAASDNEVVVLWHQRGRSPNGAKFDGEVLGLYQLRDGRLARAQMFYFDTVAVNNFLARAVTREWREESRVLFAQVQQLPENRALLLRRSYWKLQMMRQEQWRHELKSGRFANMFSNDERALLEKLLSLGDEAQVK
jgi:ketosteroid isomerase-like protein